MAHLESLADAPGKKREYETIFILHPETQNDGVAAVNDRVKGVIETMGGTVLKVDNWGKRRLAYDVKKNPKGIYLYWQYLGTTGLVDEIERNLRMLDACIRYLTVKVDENVDPDARPSEMDDDAYVRAATTAEEVEESYDTAGRDDDDMDRDDDDIDDVLGDDDDSDRVPRGGRDDDSDSEDED